MREVIITSILQGFDQKNRFLFNLISIIWDWGLGTNLKFYTNVEKGLKLKARKY